MPAVELTEAHSGSSAQVRLGDEIILRLPENPTTGYRWEIQHTGPGIEPLARSFVVSPNPKVGGGGIREFMFRAKGLGLSRIELKRLQAWEGEKSVDARFTLDVIVSE